MDKRRVQNSIRRFFEYALERFVLILNPSYSHSLQSVLSCPKVAGVYAQAMFQYLTKSSESPITTEDLYKLLASQEWWPPELDSNDRDEILDGIALTSSESQLDFITRKLYPQ